MYGGKDHIYLNKPAALSSMQNLNYVFRGEKNELPNAINCPISIESIL